MPEQPGDEPFDERTAKVRFERKAVRNLGTARNDFDGSLVPPEAQAERRRLLNEATTFMKFDQGGIDPINGKKAEQEEPGPEQRFPQLYIEVEHAGEATRHRHSGKGVQLREDAGYGGRPGPRLLWRGLQFRLEVEGVPCQRRLTRSPPNGPGAQLRRTALTGSAGAQAPRRQDDTTPRLERAVRCQLQRLARRRISRNAAVHEGDEAVTRERIWTGSTSAPLGAQRPRGSCWMAEQGLARIQPEELPRCEAGEDVCDQREPGLVEETFALLLADRYSAVVGGVTIAGHANIRIFERAVVPRARPVIRRDEELTVVVDGRQHPFVGTYRLRRSSRERSSSRSRAETQRLLSCSWCWRWRERRDPGWRLLVGASGFRDPGDSRAFLPPHNGLGAQLRRTALTASAEPQAPRRRECYRGSDWAERCGVKLQRLVRRRPPSTT